MLRTALFWVTAQPVVVISYRRFGTTCRSHLSGLKTGPIGSPEASVPNHHYSLHNNPEQRSAHLLRGGSLKSRANRCCCTFCKCALMVLVETFLTEHTVQEVRIATPLFAVAGDRPVLQATIDRCITRTTHASSRRTARVLKCAQLRGTPKASRTQNGFHSSG